MPDIPFTQYLLPDGRKRAELIERPDEICALASDIQEEGYRFEAEILTTGDVSLTIVGPPPDDPYGEELDVAIEVVPNGPEVPEAVDRMIQKFHKRLRPASAL